MAFALVVFEAVDLAPLSALENGGCMANSFDHAIIRVASIQLRALALALALGHDAQGESRLSPGLALSDEDTAARRTSRHDKRILIVDDNIDSGEMLAALLETWGHHPHHVADGPAALAEKVPDIVLLDIGLPGMDGYEVAARIRATADRHPVRIISLSVRSRRGPPQISGRRVRRAPRQAWWMSPSWPTR